MTAQIADECASLLPHQAFTLHLIEYDLTDVSAVEREYVVIAIAAALIERCSASAFVARLSGARFGIINPFMAPVRALAFTARHRDPILVRDPHTGTLSTFYPRIGFTTVMDASVDPHHVIARAEFDLQRDRLAPA